MTRPLLILVLAVSVLGWTGCVEPTAQRAADYAAPETTGATASARGEATGTRVQISGRWATVWASSELASSDGQYAAAKAFDGDPTTAWVEGVAGYGATDGAGEVATRYPLDTAGGDSLGESIHVRFDDPVVFDGIALQPGFLKSARLYERNGVPTTVEVRVDGRTVGTYKIPYPMALVFEGEGGGSPDPRLDGCYHAATGPYAAERLVVFGQPMQGTEMTVRLRQAGLGSAHEDTAISEIRPVVQSASDPAEFIVGILRRPLVSMTGAEVQDLRRVSISAHEVIDWGSRPLPKPPSPSDEGLLRPRVTADMQDWTVPEIYEVESWNHLIDVGLVVESSSAGTTVTGGVSDSEGDGEWAEVRPQLQIGSEDRLSSAREVLSFGAVPGCPGDISRLAPIPTASGARPSSRLLALPS